MFRIWHTCIYKIIPSSLAHRSVSYLIHGEVGGSVVLQQFIQGPASLHAIGIVQGRPQTLITDVIHLQLQGQPDDLHQVLCDIQVTMKDGLVEQRLPVTLREGIHELCKISNWLGNWNGCYGQASFFLVQDESQKDILNRNRLTAPCDMSWHDIDTVCSDCS